MSFIVTGKDASGQNDFYVNEEIIYDYNDEGDEIETDSVTIYALSLVKQQNILI